MKESKKKGTENERKKYNNYINIVFEKLIVVNLAKQFRAFYWTLYTYITIFTSTPPLIPILSQMNPVYTLRFHSLRSVLILSFHLLK
jgi:hypothetical protein